MSVCFLVGLSALIPAVFSYNITLQSPYGLAIIDGNTTIVNNSAILVGNQNTTTRPLGPYNAPTLPNNTEYIDYRFITPTIAKIQLNTSFNFVGARFTADPDSHFVGVWEYPWSNQITNKNVSYDLKGVGNSEGINWCSARAPFFITSAGYGVYTDTLKMGSYNFMRPGEAQYIFNSSSLVYYIILPKSKGDYKSIIEQYTALSARSEMPPTSGLGPTFWSDDFTQDFHGSVSNAQENFYDVVNHLYYNRIRATSMFADRPYGTGNRSFGNFDFDPKFYPNPKGFIANLSDYGFDFQVWIANRAFLNTQLFNTSSKNNWLFPGVDPVQFLGPALNLSIPAAYEYFEKRLEYFPSIGVKGYKIDRGEEEEMPKWGGSKFYNFARSAVDRSRARTAIWNGDARATFTGLAYSVASGIRSGIISFPIWGSDTGGYVRGQGAMNPTEELWARWMWFSAFSPVYEFMLGTNHTPWYPPYTNQIVNILEKTANLHHDLLPFMKSHAYAASKTGIPIMRALFLEASGDEESWEISDEYFLGKEFLVAPIVEEGGERKIYFPKGASAKYLEYFDKEEVHDAGSTAEVRRGVDSVPVYVTQGAIVPRGDVYQGNAKWVNEWRPSLTVEVFPSFEVEELKFVYFDGEGAEGRTAEIKIATDEESGSVKVAYGDLGANGTFVVYLKGREEEVELKKGGGEFVLEDVKTLF
ncbi:glycoside hydrolase family 31 protein [Zopfia rhizophila CBS 207.26]|uniref:Glycoside hydrolase family 31 protein n=1 Tax=Zopfia rhizophila CBS 207.26 TaxID=1314779 RepID=A0A6A6E505_9PEZI|nr:glycoside hydrolase family 31 protein [Zopfia rhizophila CBS 207.26]